MFKHVFLFFALFLVSCGPTYNQRSQSDTLHEPATVTETCYSPGFHHIDIDTSVDGDGNITITPVSCSVPEQYAVVFRCQHGKFVIREKRIWEKCARDDEVDITYQELYNDTYDRQTKKMVKREVYDYHFIDANVTNAERKGK
jgi:hypothetical protein